MKLSQRNPFAGRLRGISSNRKGVLALSAGTAGGQILAFRAAPLLTRLYSPADFGVFTVVSSMVITFGTVAAFRFDFAVPLPKKDEDAYSLVFLGLFCSLLSLSGGMLLVALLKDNIVNFYGESALLPWLWLVPGF